MNTRFQILAERPWADGGMATWKRGRNGYEAVQLRLRGQPLNVPIAVVPELRRVLTELHELWLREDVLHPTLPI